MAIDVYADQAVHDSSIEKKYGGGDASPIIDSEKGTPKRYEGVDGRVGARIAPVLPHLSGYDFGDDDSGSDILGKQIEMELAMPCNIGLAVGRRFESPRLASAKWLINIQS
jgi:hypothetical protein